MKKGKYLIRDLKNISQYDTKKLNEMRLKLKRGNIDGIGGGDIKFLRKEILRELQEEFAKRFKVGQTAVSQWESGERKPSGSALIILEQMLNQIFEEIVEWKVRKEIQ